MLLAVLMAALTTARTKERKPKADIPPPASSEQSSAVGLATNITGAGFFFLECRNCHLKLHICYFITFEVSAQLIIETICQNNLEELSLCPPSGVPGK